MDPNGKVAIITGGASGIGLATARLLAAKGARVLLADLDAERGAQAAAGIGADALFVRVDVLRPGDLQHMLNFAASEFGRVDIVHNNAGVNEGGQNLFDPGADYWERTIDIDLKAVIRATQLEVQFLRKQGGGGVIVNTASMGGMVPMPTSPVYAAAKAGVIQFTRSLAYLANEGIRVNAVCPTFTDTPMVRVAGDAAIEMMKREVGGILQPEDVAAGVLELVKDDSRAGAIMRVTVRKGLDYTFERR
jgi:NAD(P)-dependent dehydrogenase (short-subunit alcohol dehydrogenase family)